jgi:hypothetical protein
MNINPTCKCNEIADQCAKDVLAAIETNRTIGSVIGRAFASMSKDMNDPKFEDFSYADPNWN